MSLLEQYTSLIPRQVDNELVGKWLLELFF